MPPAIEMDRNSINIIQSHRSTQPLHTLNSKHVKATATGIATTVRCSIRYDLCAEVVIAPSRQDVVGFSLGFRVSGLGSRF